MSGEALDSVRMSAFIVERATSAGLDPRELMRAAGLPGWVMTADHAMVPSGHYLRVWELVEHGLADSDVALRTAAPYVPGRLGLYDYLYSTAGTLEEALETCGPYMATLSTNFSFGPAVENDKETGYEVRLFQGEGRGRELAMQFALASIVTRAGRATGRPMPPVRVTLRQRAPRRHDAFAELFGTGTIDFEAPADTVTFRRADLSAPHRTADPMLAGILRRCAAAAKRPPSRAVTWTDRVQQILALSLTDGPPSLATVAHDLAVSPRTLQRRLAESGTSWRHELDLARQSHFEQASAKCPGDLNALAHEIGFSDFRALRRARRRWTSSDARYGGGNPEP